MLVYVGEVATHFLSMILTVIVLEFIVNAQYENAKDLTKSEL